MIHLCPCSVPGIFRDLLLQFNCICLFAVSWMIILYTEKTVYSYNSVFSGSNFHFKMIFALYCGFDPWCCSQPSMMLGSSPHHNSIHTELLIYFVWLTIFVEWIDYSWLMRWASWSSSFSSSSSVIGWKQWHLEWNGLDFLDSFKILVIPQNLRLKCTNHSLLCFWSL